MNFDRFRYTLRAVMFEYLRMPEKAIEAYQNSFRADPKDARCAASIAWIHAQKQRWAPAADWFRKALEIDGGNADAWFNLAYVLEQGGLSDEAGAAHRRAAELNPKHDRAWYGLGMILAKTGDHLAAAEAFQHSADLQPLNGVAWYALGMARFHANQPDEVEKVIRHLAAHEPQTAKRLVQDAQRPDLQGLLPF
jgi:tetratricopeptide (TPR) repeat protein